MRLNVTRKQVIEALRTEPLRGNKWFHIKMSEITGRAIIDKKMTNNSKCAVCAVGSILDCALGKTEEANDLNQFASDIVTHANIDGFIGDYNTDIAYGDKKGKKLRSTRDPKKLFAIATLASKDGMHLSGLSMLFEGLYKQKRFRRKGRIANKRLRDILVKFVKQNFPKRLIATENKSI